jgi:hypothetical protein
MHLSRKLFLLLSIVSCTSWANDSKEQQLSTNDFGDIGYWQTPSARMRDDGTLDFSVSHITPYTRGNISLQGLPWFQLIIRYTDISNVAYAASTTGQSNKDKSIDAKFRLLKEDYYWPEISLGFRDFGGTGHFSSEYINASKRFGSLDATLGLAWGNMAGTGQFTNPLCSLSNTMCNRGHQTGMGGTIGFENFFRGQTMGVFGGLEYQTPHTPLRLKLEYDSNDYQREANNNNQRQRSRINFGAVYRLFQNFDVSIAYERGDKILLAANFVANLKNPTAMPKSDLGLIELRTSPVASKIDWQLVNQNLNDQAGFDTQAIYQNGDVLTLYGTQRRYRDEFVGLSRTAYVLHNQTSADIEYYRIIQTDQGLPVEVTTLSRNKLEQYDESRLIDFDQQAEQFDNLKNIESPMTKKSRGKLLWQSKNDRLHYFLVPKLAQSLGGPDAFYLYKLNAFLGANYKLGDHWLLTGSVSYDVFNNMDIYKYEPPPAPMPRVRSDLRQYLTTSRFGISSLQANYFDSANDVFYGQVYGGYLESMYAGIGGEVLFRPKDSRYAIGLDINAVQQRAFNRLFGLQPYKVLTGHLTAYYQLPIYQILAKVSVGRYLAKDVGTTINLSRQFQSGITLGGFATFTNVSAHQFGEGSFNKGFYLTIPFDLFTIRSTTQRATFSWVPLTRDGGQMLLRRYSLYDIVSKN